MEIGVFRKTSPQMSMLESQFLLPAPKRKRLEGSWAHAFRSIVLPLIDEELFRESFHDSNGRPNKSIRLMVGLAILKEMNDLTDAEVIDALEFNLQFHYALAVEPGTAHVCQKTIHNHRVLMLESDRSRLVFERITRGLAEADGLKLGRQRLDSTHVMSNIAVLTRLSLFVETVTVFLRALGQELPAKLEVLDPGYVHRYLEREGYFADAKRRQARRRIRAVASDLYRIVTTFEADKEVSALPSFVLLKRLFEEQCEVVTDEASSEGAVTITAVADESADKQDPQDGEDDGPVEPGPMKPRSGRETAPIRLRQGKEISSSSLQSPHDPDATYGHKGKGYEVQVAETCETDNGYQVITAISVNGANESDQKATVAVVKQLATAGLKPTKIYADTGYGSGANIVACADLGVDLRAPVPDPKSTEKEDKMGEPVERQALIEPAPESAAAGDGSPPDEAEAPVVQRADAPETLLEEEKLTLGDFTFADEFRRLSSCPAGNEPASQHLDGGHRRLWARFSKEGCATCSLASRCPTRLLKSDARTLQTSVNKAATATRQREQQTSEFKEEYKIRSGIESTNAELKSRHGAGSMRVRGKVRVAMSMQMKATAVNVKRATTWHAAQVPPGPEETRALASSLDTPNAPETERPVPRAVKRPPPPPGQNACVSWLASLSRRFLERLRGGPASPRGLMSAAGAGRG